MLTLYLDCDGVILDTINKSYQMLKDNGITDPFQIQEFYRNLDWNKLIIEAGEIDNSIIICNFAMSKKRLYFHL